MTIWQQRVPWTWGAGDLESETLQILAKVQEAKRDHGLSQDHVCESIKEKTTTVKDGAKAEGKGFHSWQDVPGRVEGSQEGLRSANLDEMVIRLP